MRRREFSLFALLAVVTGATTGCYRSEFVTTPVQGRVLCQGDPVTQGQVTFSPIPQEGKATGGKTAMAVVQPDGTFRLATYKKDDGAIIGKHRVMYSAPDARSKSSPCGDMVIQEIEITKGIQELTIELSKKTAAR